MIIMILSIKSRSLHYTNESLFLAVGPRTVGAALPQDRNGVGRGLLCKALQTKMPRFILADLGRKALKNKVANHMPPHRSSNTSVRGASLREAMNSKSE